MCRPFRARVVFGFLPGAMPQAVVRGWFLIGVDLAGRPFPAAAPTARIMAAWGIAPGVLATPSQALKGRNTVCRPFRARVVFGFLPGAMPQAVVRSPDGAGF